MPAPVARYKQNEVGMAAGSLAPVVPCAVVGTLSAFTGNSTWPIGPKPQTLLRKHFEHNLMAVCFTSGLITGPVSDVRCLCRIQQFDLAQPVHAAIDGEATRKGNASSTPCMRTSNETIQRGRTSLRLLDLGWSAFA
jgi:hypothetical protein